MPDDVRQIFGAEIPFANFCGLEELGVVDGRTQLRLTLEPQHLNNLGIAHGGIIATLLDVAMGTAARTMIGTPVMTLDMNVAFLNPGRGEMIAEGRVLKAGRSIVFCEAEAKTADGETVARATGTLKAARSANRTEAPK